MRSCVQEIVISIEDNVDSACSRVEMSGFMVSIGNRITDLKARHHLPSYVFIVVVYRRLASGGFQKHAVLRYSVKDSQTKI